MNATAQIESFRFSSAAAAASALEFVGFSRVGRSNNFVKGSLKIQVYKRGTNIWALNTSAFDLEVYYRNPREVELWAQAKVVYVD